MTKRRERFLRVCVLTLGAASIAIPIWAQQTGPLPPPTNPPAQATSPSTTDKQENQTAQPSQNNGATQPPAGSSSTAAANAAAPVNAPANDSSAPATALGTSAKPAVAKVVVPSGTHLPLVLHNAVTTRSAKPGDPVYLETLFPIMADGHVVIPAGSYVSGEVTEAKRPGKVKGTGEIMIKLNTLILPNGYMVNLNASPGGSAGTGGNESVDNEGRIKGDTDKTGDIGTVATTTATGAAIGGLASRTPAGAGIGAGIGAAAGLLAVLLTRGPEAELPRGTTLEAVLDRPIYLDADKVQFTSPGQASTLAGPPNREPVRTRENPF